MVTNYALKPGMHLSVFNQNLKVKIERKQFLIFKGELSVGKTIF